MRTFKPFTTALAVLSTMVLAASLQAAPIGVKFIGRENDTGGLNPFTPTDTAGVVPQANWNTTGAGNPNVSATDLPLVDGSGAATLVTFTFAANDCWHTDGATDTPDARLMKGIVKVPSWAKGDANINPMKLTFKGLDPNGAYDVYTYIAVNGSGVFLDIGVGGVTNYVNEPNHWGGGFVQAENRNPNAPRPLGNYVVNSAAVPDAGGQLTVTATYVSGGDGLGITAVQLVPVENLPPLLTNVAVLGQFSIRAMFSQALDPATVVPGNFTLVDAGSVAVTVTSATLLEDGRSVALGTSLLTPDEFAYTLTASAAIRGKFGAEPGEQFVEFLVKFSAISLNMVGGWEDANPAVPLDPADVAGLVPLANWNNLQRISSLVPLNDQNGAPTSVTITFDANGSWRNGTLTAGTAGDNKMLQGYFESQEVSRDVPLVLRNVPDAPYDLVAYSVSDSDPNNTDPARGSGHFGQSMWINNDPATTYYFASQQAGDYNGTWIRGTTKIKPPFGYGVGWPAANYVQWDDVRPVNGVITLDLKSETFRGRLNGIQLIPVLVYPLAFVTEPVAQTAVQNAPFTFTAVINGPTKPSPFYIQWFTNNVAIPGANGLSYTAPALPSLSGVNFTVMVSNVISAITSVPVQVTVNPTPQLLGVSQRGTTNMLWLQFNKPVDVASSAIGVTGLTVASKLAGDTASEIKLTFNEVFAPGTTYNGSVTALQDTEVPPNSIIDPILFSFNVATLASPAFCTDFSSLPAGSAIYGNAAIDSGILKLTLAVNSQAGSFVIDDIAAGTPVDHFAATFRMLIGGGTTPPADGMSFSWATDLPAGTWDEEGTGSGLSVCFDDYNNGGAEAPAIDVKWNNVVIGHVSLSQTWNSMSFIDVSLNVRPSGSQTLLDLMVDGTNVYKDLVVTGFTPQTGAKFGFGARTGGANANFWVDDLCIDIFNAGPVSIASQPVGTTVNEYQTAQFSVLADGSPPYYYQWFKGATAIPGANAPVYITPPTDGCMEGDSFTVVVSNWFSSATSATAILHVIQETIAPTVVSVQPDNNTFQRVFVVFSEPVTKTSAENVANYAFDGGLVVLSAVLQSDPTKVVLNTSLQANNTTYTLDFEPAGSPGVLDLSCPIGNRAVAGLFPLPATLTFSRGFVLKETWTGIGGGNVSDLINNAAYQGPPNESNYISQINWANADVPNDYGSRVTGYIVPSVTSSYYFRMNHDDGAEFALSTNGDPANAVVLMARGCCGDTDSTSPVSLVAGQRYYFRMFLKEGGGGDALRLYWRYAVNSDGVNNRWELVPSYNLGSVAGGATLDITSFDMEGDVDVPQGTALAMPTSATTSSTYTPFYQWQKLVGADWVNIVVPGSMVPTYTIANASPADAGQYRVYVSVPGASGVGAVGIVHVTANPNVDYVISRGFLKWEQWPCTGNNDFPTMFGCINAGAPDSTTYLTSFASPESSRENYAGRLTGYIVPAVTGDYLFEVHSDDNSMVMLSSNDDPALGTLLVEEPACCSYQQTLTPRHLVAGQRYAVTAYMKEGGGGDYVELRWKNGTTVPNYVIIPGAELAVQANSVGTTLTLAPLPPSVSVRPGDPLAVTLSVTASPNFVFYQWQKLVGGIWYDIPGANSATLGTTYAQLSDAGDYRAYVSIPGNSATSTVATLTVACDSVPPVLVSAGSTSGNAIGAMFSAAPDPVTATNVMNYSVNGGEFGDNIAGVTLLPAFNGYSVIIGLSNAVAGSFTLTASNVVDLCPGSEATNSTVSGGVLGWNSQITGVAGNPNPATSTNASFADQELVIVTGGGDNWDAEDHNQFVYTERCGDFDIITKVARLDYQSGWTKGGIQARVSLAANSPVIETYLNPTNGANQVESGLRTTFGGGTGDWQTIPRPSASGNPWIRLARVGDVFKAYSSPNGVDWTNHATTVQCGWATNLYVGLFATPNNANNGNTTTAVFTNYQLSPQGFCAPKISCGLVGVTYDGAGNVTVQWNDPCCRLQGATELNSNPALTVWTDIAGTSPLTLPSGSPPVRFFRTISP